MDRSDNGKKDEGNFLDVSSGFERYHDFIVIKRGGEINVMVKICPGRLFSSNSGFCKPFSFSRMMDKNVGFLAMLAFLATSF